MGRSIEKAGLEVPSCPVCGNPLDTRELVLCQRCQTPHHRSCWSYNKGCGVYACSCRTMVLPVLPQATDGNDPRLCFRYDVLRPDDSFGAFWAVVLLLTLAYRPVAALALLGGLLLPMLVSMEHRANPSTGMLERRRRFGPLTLWQKPAFLPFHQIECLELRKRGTGDPVPWEVWARTGGDRAFLLEILDPCSLEEAVARVEFPAEQIDTVVSLPRGQGEGRLPSGLDETLRSLPSGDSEL